MRGAGVRAVLLASLVLGASVGLSVPTDEALVPPHLEAAQYVAVSRYDLHRTGVASDAFDIPFTNPWSFLTNGSSATSALAADVDGDGNLELVFGEMGGGSPRQGYVVDRLGHLRYTVKMHGDSYAAAVADLDGDALPELVFAEGSTGFRVFDTDGSFLWNVTVRIDSGDVVASPAVTDVDGDGLPDLISGSTDGSVYAFRGTNGSMIWSTPLGEAVWTSAVPIGDLEGDGDPEVVVETVGGLVHALNATSGAVRWSFRVGSGPLRTLGLADLDGDGRLEIVAGHCGAGGVVSVRSNGTVMWQHTTVESCYRAPALVDVTGDALPDVVAVDSTSDRRLVAYYGTNGTEAWRVPLTFDEERAFQPLVAAIMDDGQMYILLPFSLGDFAYIMLRLADTGYAGWVIFMGSTRSVQGESLVRDLDGDGAAEMAIAAGDGRLYLLSRAGGPPSDRPPVPDAGPGYEAGEGEPVTLTAAASSDPDGDPLTFRWDFDGDGTWDTNWSSDPDATHTWGDDWTGTVTVEVSDGNLTATDDAPVVVNNVAPSIAFTAIPAGDEAETLEFQARATDPGSDDLTVSWQGSCAGWSPPTSYLNDPAFAHDPDPSPTLHPRNITDVQSIMCGDNSAYDWNLTVEDDDGGATTVYGTFSVDNLPPSFAIAPPTNVSVDEGMRAFLNATAEDPGTDDLAFAWSWQFGPTETHTYYNDGVSPDPPESPDGMFPFAATDGSSFVYGDDGTYGVALTVTDDDGGSVTVVTAVEVGNVAPSIDAGPDLAGREGSPVSFSFLFSDPGFDQPLAGTVEDFTATVDWGDGTSEPLSVTEAPGGPGVASTGTMNGTHVFADNGVFAVTVTVCDDDGGCGSDVLTVDVANVAPTVDAGPDLEVDEGAGLAIVFSFSDPGFDFPPAGTVEDFTATVDWGYGPPESPSVTEVPGGPGIPTRGAVSVTHSYGDNGIFTVTVTVCDDDGGCGSDSMAVTARNVPPAIEDVQVFVLADVTLRVAGEKWHDVRMDLIWNGGTTATVRVVRTPGSPDDQSATIDGRRIQFLGDFRITLYYTPDDDPVNGQPNGANPAWVILTSADRSEVRLQHTFNARQADTWAWTLDDLRPALAGREITFEVGASDPGSDDLTFTWDFGDGATATATHFNDGVGPDPFPSPQVNPVTATDSRSHTYALSGRYTVRLTVVDDDAGETSMTFTLDLGP